MSTEYRLYQPHAVPALHIDDTERQLGEAYLRRAHAAGQLSTVELDRRLEIVGLARDRGELNTAFLGLVHRPQGATAAPTVGLRPRRRITHPVAMAAHLSVFGFWLFGPVLFYLLARPGTTLRREAAKAFNAQLAWALVAAFVTVVGGIVGVGHHHGVGLGWLWPAWFVLTVVAAVRAGRGDDWRNPVSRIIPLRPLKP